MHYKKEVIPTRAVRLSTLFNRLMEFWSQNGLRRASNLHTRAHTCMQLCKPNLESLFQHLITVKQIAVMFLILVANLILDLQTGYGHMDKQENANEMETGNGNETETGNGNWKLKWRQKMETQPLSCCSPRKIRVLLAFVPRHPRALLASSF